MRIQTIFTKNLRWIDVRDPDEEDIRWLKQNFKFHPLHFQTLSEHQQRPHIDQQAGYDFIVLLFPVYSKKTHEIVPGEVDFAVGDGFLLTVHYGQIFSLKQLFAAVKENPSEREAYMQKGSGYLLYKILESLFRRSYPILDHMDEDVEKIEELLFRKGDLNILSSIALMKKNIIEFRKMMKTHRFVLEKLPKRKTSYLLFPQSRFYYKDLLEYSQNIWDILEALKETAETLHDTSQSLATHRLQAVTKVISIFSAVVIPATLIAFLFGTGVEGIPFKHHPQGFWIVAGLMVLASVLLLVVFKIKKMF